jgi:hypothetical protein
MKFHEKSMKDGQNADGVSMLHETKEYNRL